MNKYVVTYTRTPTNFNSPTSLVVEAASGPDAVKIVRDSLRDLGTWPNYDYKHQPYEPPPAGRILGPA